MSRGEPSSLSVRKTVVGANPAAGAEIADTVPAGKWWELLSVRLTLTSAAAVANRRPALALDDGTNEFWRWRAGVDQPASIAARLYQFLISLSAEQDRSATFNELYEPLDEGLILTPGSHIRTVTAGLQAADDYAAAIYYIVEYG